MQVTQKNITPTKIKLTVIADEKDIKPLKDHALEHLRDKVKLPGFRNGKAPLPVVEKNVDANTLQAEFLEEAVNTLYQRAVTSQKLRPVDNPQVNLTKFVPYTVMEFDAELEVIGKVTLMDYKKVKVARKEVKVTAKDINEVIESLKTRTAEKKDVIRAAKNGDEVTIDFKGVDAKGEAINGADGKDYPLTLGSHAFIPGFEENVVGIKLAEEKTFTITFPKDYGVKALASKKVTFTVTAKAIKEVVELKLDDAFAAKVGPFKTVDELKADVKVQLTAEKVTQAQRALENEIILEIVDKSSLDLPEVLVQEQIERLKEEVRQNLIYRSQTWEEMLAAEDKTEEEYEKNELRPEAERRVKTGLVLAEISVTEKLEVTPEELDIRMQLLRCQYTDPTMQAELEKPQSRREIASRLLTEKTVDHLVQLATSK